MPSARLRPSRRTALAAGSLAAHAVVLAFLALPHIDAFPDRSNDEDTLTVFLERPRHQAMRAPSQAPPQAAAPSMIHPRTPPRTFASSVAPLAVGRASGVGTAPHPAPLPEGPRGDLRTALRGSAVGCANALAVGLNRRELERCHERWGQAARNAPVYANAPASADAAAQMARQAASQEADLAYRTGRIPQGVDRGDPGKPLDIPFALGAEQNGEGRPVSEFGQRIKRLDDARKADDRRKQAAREREW